MIETNNSVTSLYLSLLNTISNCSNNEFNNIVVDSFNVLEYEANLIKVRFFAVYLHGVGAACLINHFLVV